MLMATTSQAQTIGLSGNYHESNGIIVNIPQNPPTAPCDNTLPNARCHFRQQAGLGGAAPPVTEAPQVGNYGAVTIPGTPGDIAVDQSFTIPPLAFSQMFPVQVGIVLNSVTIQLDTTFTAVMPGAVRTFNEGLTSQEPGFAAPVSTRNFANRSFSVTNRPAFGQNNGLTTMDPGYVYRQAIETTVMDTFGQGAERFTMVYTNSEPGLPPGTPGDVTTGFTGTATILLANTGRLYLAGPGIDAVAPPTFRPVIGTNPVGVPTTELRLRNAGGWGYTVTGNQAAGLFKGFPTPTSLAPPIIPQGLCTVEVPPALPEGCNRVVGFDTRGITLAALPTANSTKFMFAWTTGTVSVMREATRQPGSRLDTLTVTGMGHDFTSMTTGGDTVRRVGLVAGSYTKREDGQGTQNLNHQLAGLNLVLTPEPGATMALISGIGVLGALGIRRRRS
jgi:hypothetical protein